MRAAAWAVTLFEYVSFSRAVLAASHNGLPGRTGSAIAQTLGWGAAWIAAPQYDPIEKAVATKFDRGASNRHGI